MNTPDAYDLWEARDRDQAGAEERLPQCEACGDTILDDFCWEIEGTIYCEECAKKRFRKLVENCF